MTCFLTDTVIIILIAGITVTNIRVQGSVIRGGTTQTSFGSTFSAGQARIMASLE
jgi:hypothetical protein